MKQLLETNGDQRLTALAEALARVPDQAQVALETALRAASSDLEEKYQAAGLQGPFVRVKGFVTAFNVVGGVGTTTVTTVNGDEVALSLVPATEIEDTIVVGDFVKAKYNLDLQAKSIEIDSDELTLKGTVATFTSSTLELADGTRLIIDEFTDIDGDLAVDIDVKVDAVPEDGSLTALEIKVEGGDRSDQREKENEEFKIEGTITNIATSTATSTAIVVDTLPVMVIPSTKVEGALAVGIRVKVEAIMEGGVAVALEVEAKDIEEEDEDDDRDSDIRLKGLITALSDTEIEIDGFGPILITSDTVIRGNPFVNAQVEVKAVVSADEFIATRINVEDELEIKGIVASFTSTMLVLADGTTLAIDADTRIIGALAVGAKVEIKADIQSDGKLLATRVKGEEKMEFEGTVAGFSSTTLTLIEGDITFVIDGETRLKGTLSEDAGVEVKAEVSAGGALVATRIKVEREEKHEKDEGEKAKFEGTVATFSSTSLVLVQGDRAFVITDDTAIKGTLSEGAGVKVEAIRSNGDLIATEIEVRDNDNEDNGERDGGDKSGKFEGTVATFNSTSLVLVPGDRAFVITDDTAIKGTLSEGAGVKVEAIRSNGDLVATKIEVRDNGNEDNDDDEGDGKEEGSDRDASNRKDEEDGKSESGGGNDDSSESDRGSGNGDKSDDQDQDDRSGGDEDENDDEDKGSDRDASNRKDEEDGKSESGGGNDDSSESDRGSGNGDKSDDQDQDDRSGGDGDEAGKEDKDDGKDDDEGKETTEETDNKDEDGSSDGNN